MEAEAHHPGLSEFKESPGRTLGARSLVHQGDANFSTFKRLQAGVVGGADDFVVVLVTWFPFPRLHPIEMPALLIRLGMILPRLPGRTIPGALENPVGWAGSHTSSEDDVGHLRRCQVVFFVMCLRNSQA